MSDVIVPSDPKELKKLKSMIVEMTNSLSKQDQEREVFKEIADEATRQFDIPKKMINKLARTMYKRNYSDLQAENADFELLYETLTGQKADLKVVGE